MSDTRKRVGDLTPEQQRALLAQMLEKRAKEPQAYPLALAQQRLWFLHRLVPQSGVYNVPYAVRLAGALDAEALQKSHDALARRHGILRTTLPQRDGRPVQRVAPDGSWPIEVVDLERLPHSEREREALRLANEEAARGFDLEHGPLARAFLYRLGERDHLLLWVLHHITCEGWSIALLYEELERLYEAFSAGRPSPLPDPEHQYHEFARWQREWLKEDQIGAELEFWRETLAGPLPTLELPTDRPRPPVQSLNGAWTSALLSPELTAGLERLSRAHGATLFMTMLAAFQVLLHRYTEHEDILVGAPVAGRNRPETERLIGFFVNTIVLRTDMSGEPSFDELLERVHEVCTGAFSNQDLPFEKLVEELNPERSLSHTPVFQVIFSLQNTPEPALALPGLESSRLLTPEELHNGGTKVDLALFVHQAEDTLKLSFEYNTDLFDERTVVRMLGHLRKLLEGAVDDPSRSIRELPLLTDGERDRILVEWNATRAELTDARCVHEMFEEQADRAPDAPAVVSDEGQLTYGELERRANRLARRLSAIGVGSGDLVAICTERTPEMAVAILATLKAGGAYLPIDLAYPDERIAFMLDDAGVRVVLSRTALRGDLPPFDGETIFLDDDAAGLADESPERLGRPSSLGDLAYVIYTSGSTGRPKGVEIEHGGLLNLVSWHRRRYQVSPADRATHLAGLAFDASVWELWPYLTAGAGLWLVDDDVRLSAQNLALWMAENGITLSFLPTPLAEAVLAEPLPKRLALRALLTGGDKLQRAPQRELPFELVNHYGPTENTVVATAGTVAPAPGSTSAPTIGRPIDNVRVYLLDRAMAPVPVGVPGQLYVGGASLARGYRRRPRLTAKKFVADPFSGDPGARLYATGDLARYLPSGEIEFLGRIDHQVKVRGFRIELGEIESVLGQHDAVRDAVALVREDTPGDRRLVAYVTAERNEAPSITALRDHLRKKLPDHMIPQSFVTLDEMPLTKNGKIKRSALPAPDAQRPVLEEVFLGPRDDVETKLVEIWEQVLERSPIGVRDDFFDLGGHSMIALQLFARIEDVFDVRLPLDTLFQSPTVERLAADIHRGAPAEMASLVIAIQPDGSRPPLFGVPAAASPGIVFAPLAKHLGADQPFYGLTPPRLEGHEPPSDWWVKIASRFKQEIKEIQPEGPYYVAGQCFGGILAYELAQQLVAGGDEVGALLLMDAGYPLEHGPVHKLRRSIIGFWARTANVLRSGGRWDVVVIPKHRPRWDILNDEERIAANENQQAWDANLRAAAEYETRPYAGRVTLIQSRELDAYRSIKGDWRRFAGGGVDYRVVDCDHVEMLREPHVEMVAETIHECIDDAQRHRVDIRKSA